MNKILGTINNDILQAETNDDSLYGFEGDDVLRGTIGWNSGSTPVTGGGEDNTLYVNEMYGGNGNDRYISVPGVSFPIYSLPVVWGSLYGVLEIHEDLSVTDNADTLDLSEYSSNSVLTSSFDGNNLMVANATLIDNYGVDNVGNLIAGVEYVEMADGTIYDTRVQSDMFSFVVNGTDTRDIITADAENNVIDGGNGNDRIDAGAGNDVVAGGQGRDVLLGREGDDTLYGGNGNDRLIGHDGNDVLYGGDGDDFIRGGRGDDIIIGGRGNDNLAGQGGKDIFVFEDITDAGVDTVFSFRDRHDSLDLSDLLSDYSATDDLITDFIQITTDGTNTVLSVDKNGAANGAEFTDVVILDHYTNMTSSVATEDDVQNLISNGVLIV